MTDYSTLTRQEVSALIAEKIEIASQAVKEAEDIAEASGVGFSLDLGGYGMGGYYEPNGKGWLASSQSC
jgi:hypothetical protein